MTKAKPTRLSLQIKRYIFAAVAGNGLENYDFAIFGYMTPILAKNFFPSTSVFSSLINIFAIFAVGFLGRPLGALLLGQLGDRKGRKKALLISIFLMAISTGLMGCLPTYKQVGLWTPILLMLLRIFQGMSIGGEYTSCLSYLLEHAPPEKRGFVASWMNVGSCLGLLFGAIVSLLTTTLMPPGTFETWGWRLPFI